MVRELEDAGIVKTLPMHDGTRMLALASRQVQHIVARFAFALDDNCRAGAHVVLAAYWMGRDAPKGWALLPHSHPRHKMCATAHGKLMENPLFPSQPWYWDGALPLHTEEESASGIAHGRKDASARGNGVAHAGRQRVYNVRKLQQLVGQLLAAGLLEAAQACLTDLQYLAIKFEACRVHEVVAEYETLRLCNKARGSGDSCFLDAAGQFEQFVVASRAIFERNPHLMFQSACNSKTQGDAMSRAAALTLSLRREHPPWLHWMNAPRDNDLGALWTLQAHPLGVSCLALSPNAAWLATCCVDAQCRIWDVATGILKQTLPRANARVHSLAWSADALYLAVGDGLGGVKMWQRKRHADLSSQVAEFGVTAHDGPVQALVFAKGVGVPKDDHDYNTDKGLMLLLTAGSDGSVKVWHCQTHSVIRVLKAHQGTVHGLAVRAAPAPAPGSALMARIIAQRLAARHAQGGNRRSPHKSRLPPVALPNGFAAVMSQRAAAGSSDGVSQGGEGARVMSYGGDHCIREWQVDTGLCLRSFKGHCGPVLSVDMAEELDILVSASEDKVCLVWRLSDASIVAAIRHDTPVAYIAIDLVGETIATLCKEGLLRLWDVHTMVRVGKTDAVGMQAEVAGQRAEGLHKTTAFAKSQGLIVSTHGVGGVKAFNIRALVLCVLRDVAHDARDTSPITSAKLPSNFTPAGFAPRHLEDRGGADDHADTKEIGRNEVTALCVGGEVMCSATAAGELGVWDSKTGDSLWRVASG